MQQHEAGRSHRPAAVRTLMYCSWPPPEQSAVSLIRVVQLVAGGASVTGQIAWLGISATELACFVGFWGLQVKLVCCRITAGFQVACKLLGPAQQPLLWLPLPP